MTDRADDIQTGAEPNSGNDKPWLFKPGQSGNPAGRKAGSRNRASVLLDQIGDEAAEGVLKAVIAKAMDGDTASAALVLSRAWVAKKNRSVAVELPTVETTADIMAALSAVLSSVADGTLTPDEGTALSGILEIKRKAIESQILEARIAALEAKTQP